MIIAGYLQKIGFKPRGLVHVGGHCGQEMQAYFDLGVDNLIWVEADPSTAARLRQIVASSSLASRQRVIEALITDRDGDIRNLHRFSNDGESSSIFRATDILHARWPGIVETGETVEIRTSRLDTALMAAGFGPGDIDVIVLDVQGAEILALDGCGAFLESASYVEAEVSLESIYAGGPLADDVVARLARAGFKPVTEIPWHGDVVFSRSA